jgi:hypothetical protein
MEDISEIESLSPFYNCSECSSPIELISFDTKNIQFKCFNKNGGHKMTMPIKEYIEKMKIHNIEMNKEKCVVNHHYQKYECYCLDCDMHLCEECLKTREHLYHNKIIMKEVMPKINELSMIKKILKGFKNEKRFEYLKKLFEIVYNTYIKFSNNYYHCINVNHILITYIENLQKDGIKLSEEMNELLAQKIDNKNLKKNNEQMKDNNKLSEEINKIKYNNINIIDNNVKLNDNYIMAEFDIKYNKNIRIINSYENYI